MGDLVSWPAGAALAMATGALFLLTLSRARHPWRWLAGFPVFLWIMAALSLRLNRVLFTPHGHFYEHLFRMGFPLVFLATGVLLRFWFRVSTRRAVLGAILFPGLAILLQTGVFFHTRKSLEIAGAVEPREPAAAVRRRIASSPAFGRKAHPGFKEELVFAVPATDRVAGLPMEGLESGGEPPLVFLDPAGRSFAYQAQRGFRQVLVLDGVERFGYGGSERDVRWRAAFGPERVFIQEWRYHHGFPAARDRTAETLHVGDEAFPDVAGLPALSPDRRQFAFLGRRGGPAILFRPGSKTVVPEGFGWSRESPPRVTAQGVAVFAGDWEGPPLQYDAERRLLFVNGPIGEDGDATGPLRFNRRGDHMVYARDSPVDGTPSAFNRALLVNGRFSLSNAGAFDLSADSNVVVYARMNKDDPPPLENQGRREYRRIETAETMGRPAVPEDWPWMDAPRLVEVSGSCRRLAVSPGGGKFLCVSGVEGKMYVMRAERGPTISWTQEGPYREVHDMVFADRGGAYAYTVTLDKERPVGSTKTVAGADFAVVRDGKIAVRLPPLSRKGPPNPVSHLLFSRDGDHLAYVVTSWAAASTAAVPSPETAETPAARLNRFAVLDGRWSPGYDQLGELRFEPDGLRFLARKNRKILRVRHPLIETSH